MRIEIKENNELQIALSDDGLNNDNFIEMEFEFEEGENIKIISLDELMAALIAFDAKRSKRLSLDEKYTN